MKFVNASKDTYELPTLGLLVAPGDEFEATGDDAKSLLTNPSFERVDKPVNSEKE